jgi:outer membrane protein assembly factor BamB
MSLSLREASRWRVGLVALLVAALLLQPVLAAPTASDWPQARADAGRTAHAPAATGPTGDVGPAWVRDVDAVAFDSSLVVADDRLYLGTHRGRAVAHDAGTGQRLWSVPVADRVTGTPTAVGDTLVVPAAAEADALAATLVGLDAASGEERWRYTPTSDRPASWFRGDPTAAGDSVYLAGEFGGPDAPPDPVVLAVGATGEGAGEERWRYELPAEFEGHGLAAPAAADGTVYVLHRPADDSPRAHVLALDATDGTELWRTRIDRAAEFVLVAEGAVYATGEGATRLDAATGEVLGDPVDRAARFLPAAYAGGVLYVPSDGSAGYEDARWVVAANATTGQRLWTATVGPGDSIEAGPTVTSRYVLVPTVMGKVVAFHRANGTAAWNYTVDERLGLDQPVIPHGGTVYVAAGDLYALREGGEAVAGGLLGRVGGLLREHAALGFLVTAVGAGATTGLLLGVLSLVAVEVAGLSRSPQLLLAARLFRTPVASVRRWQRYAAHLLASVAVAGSVAALALVGWVVLPAAAALFAGALPWLVPGLSMLSLPLAVVAVALVVGVYWAVLVYRWLPANEAALDRSLARVRQDWTLVHVGFGLGLTVVFPFVAFLLALLVFQPF